MVDTHFDIEPHMPNARYAEPQMTVTMTTTEETLTDTSYIGSLRRGLTPQGLDALPAHERHRLLDDLFALGTTPAALLREPGGVFGPPCITPLVDLAWRDGTHIVLRTDLPSTVKELVRVADLRPENTARTHAAMNHILAHTFGPGPLPTRLASDVTWNFAQRLVNIYARFLRGEELPAAHQSHTRP